MMKMIMTTQINQLDKVGLGLIKTKAPKYKWAADCNIIENVKFKKLTNF